MLLSLSELYAVADLVLTFRFFPRNELSHFKKDWRRIPEVAVSKLVTVNPSPEESHEIEGPGESEKLFTRQMGRGFSG